jgi:hypothetical protein
MNFSLYLDDPAPAIIYWRLRQSVYAVRDSRPARHRVQGKTLKVAIPYKHKSLLLSWLAIFKKRLSIVTLRFKSEKKPSLHPSGI